MSLTVAIGPQPPPIHGAAVVNAAFCSRLRERSRLFVVDTAVPGSGAGYHLRRIASHAKGMLTLVRCAGIAKQRNVYITSPGALALWYLLPLVAVARLLGYRAVVHHHSYAYLGNRSRAMTIIVALAGPSGIHIALCEGMRTRFEALYKPKGATVICSNAAWVPNSSGAISRCFEDGLRIGYLGSLSPEKGLIELTQLTLRLRQSGIKAELWLAGAAPTPSARASLDDALLALGPRAHSMGVLRGAEKIAFLRNIDVFVFPTRYKHEAQPLVVFEAMAEGVPVVAYSLGCIPGELRGTGLLVSPHEQLSVRALPYLRNLQARPADLSDVRTAVRAAFVAAQQEGMANAEQLLQTMEESVERTVGPRSSGEDAPAR